MEIYIDFRKVKDKSVLAQTIKVFAMTYKEDDFFVIIDEDFITLENKENLHIIKDFDITKIKYLYTVDDELIPNNCIKLALLKTNSKEIPSILFGDLSFNKLSIEDKFNILSDRNLINDSSNYSIMSTSVGLNEDLQNFAVTHNVDIRFKGVICPKDIVSKPTNLVLTSPEIANTFIASLYYAIEFLNLKQDEKEDEEGFLSKLFSFNKQKGYGCVTLNSLLYSYNLYASNDKLIFKNADEVNYNYYYQSLTNFYNLIKK